jgi:sec-independent protein translocase protein TatA
MDRRSRSWRAGVSATGSLKREIIIIALILWGPGKLPEIARTLGKVSRALKKASFDLTSAVTREIEKEDEAKNSQHTNTETNAKKSAPYASSGDTKKQNDQPRTPEEPEP